MKGITRDAAVIALAIAAGSQATAGQTFTCFVIQPGDSASALAWRLTGEMTNSRAAWFRIVEPATSRLVAKSEYRRIQPGWHACIPENRLKLQPVIEEEVPPAAASLPPPAAPSLPAAVFRIVPPGVASVGAAVLLSLAALLAWQAAAAYSSGRRSLVLLMTLFGERFVREFERPLLRPGSEQRALQSQLRVKARQRRLEILLAPSDGRTYPNLFDHRKNVEYDVGRVLRLLNDDRFVNERLSREGHWVIVRCRFRAEPSPGGGS